MTGYHLVLRHMRGTQIAEWHDDERPWGYAEARRALLFVQFLWPRLHEPHCRIYLVAEPIQAAPRPCARDDSWGEWPS